MHSNILYTLDAMINYNWKMFIVDILWVGYKFQGEISGKCFTKKVKIASIKKGKNLAFDFPIRTISCKISPRIKGYESKYPRRMTSFLKFVNFLTLDLT